jgi:hypothetical protein
MQGFQGYGYSQKFVNNLNRVIKDINQNPDLEAEITDECDIICSCCPYNEKGVCQKGENSSQRVKNIDSQVLRKLGLRKGVRVRAKDIFSLIDKKLKSISDIQDICGECGWKEKCLWFNSRNQKKGNVKQVSQGI